MNTYVVVTQGMILFSALFFSGWFIAQCIVLFVNGMNKKSYSLPVGNVIVPSLIWAIFYIMKVLQ